MTVQDVPNGTARGGRRRASSIPRMIPTYTARRGYPALSIQSALRFRLSSRGSSPPGLWAGPPVPNCPEYVRKSDAEMGDGRGTVVVVAVVALLLRRWRWRWRWRGYRCRGGVVGVGEGGGEGEGEKGRASSLRSAGHAKI